MPLVADGAREPGPTGGTTGAPMSASAPAIAIATAGSSAPLATLSLAAISSRTSHPSFPGSRVDLAMRNPRGLLLVAGVSLAGLAGCSSADDSSATIRDIDVVLAGEIDVVADPSGTAATVEVDTTIPVACSVIYGNDDSFGSIAVDDDMRGGAHQEHGPRLTGLTPDTEYRYILQGSDAAGVVYRSEVMTFRTPVATDTGLGANIALDGAVAGASSEFSAAFAASMAIDGDLGTEWSTAGDGDDAWIEIDLGAEREIAGFAYRTREMSDGSAITETFAVAIDGASFGPFPTGSSPVALAEPVVGRFLRFDADRTTGGNTGAVEIQIFGAE